MSRARQLATENARIVAMLPIEQWIDEASEQADLDFMRLLRALLEVKRVVEGMEEKRAKP